MNRMDYSSQSDLWGQRFISSQRYLKFGRCGSNALPIDGRAALPRRRKYPRDKSTRFRALESNANPFLYAVYPVNPVKNQDFKCIVPVYGAHDLNRSAGFSVAGRKRPPTKQFSA